METKCGVFIELLRRKHPERQDHNDTSEIADADTRDFVQVDGIWVQRIQRKHRSQDQRLKTKASTRDMPLHSAILDAGFISYLQRFLRGLCLHP